MIVDSPLGWRWTFFIGVPIALISMWMIHKTLHIKHVARKVYIDWAGAVLVTVSVSVLLIWVSYVGKAGYFEFNSWQTYAMVGGSLALIALLIWVEGRVPEPVIPLRIIAMRTTALSIIASVSIGVAMFGSGAFLGQYFQVAREASPTMAGVMTLPMILGNLFGSVFSGQMISRHGRWKIFLVVGASVNIGCAGAAGHHVPRHQLLDPGRRHVLQRRRHGLHGAEPGARRAEHRQGHRHRHRQLVRGVLPLGGRGRRRRGARRDAVRQGQLRWSSTRSRPHT